MAKAKRRKAMTSDADSAGTAQKTAQPAAVSVLKAPQLIEKAVAGIPSLATEDDALKLVFGAYAQFVVPKTDVRKARELLGAFFNVKPAAVTQAVVRLNKVVLDASVEIAEEAQQSMGIEIDTRTLDIAKRSKEEVDEQNALDEAADQAIAKVQAIVTALGVNDRYAGELSAKGKKPRKSLVAPIVKGLVDSGWLKTERPLEMREELGWETPPLFDVENEEVARLLAKVEGVLSLLSENAGSPTQREQVEAQLANFNVNTADLEDTLYKVSALAYGQLDQSAKILERVRNDQTRLAKQIEAINFVKGIYAAVLNYFNPEYSLK